MKLALTSSLLLAFSLGAQNTVVVPSSAASSEGFGTDLAPGVLHDSRRLILVDMPQALHNQDVSAIAFRREDMPYDFPAGQVDLVVRMSVAPHPAVLAKEAFDQNHGAVVSTVFTGTVTLPASVSSQGRTIAWTNASDILEIPIVPAFAFTQGTLAIDIEARRVAGSEPHRWFADAAVEMSPQGAVNTLGESCSPFALTQLPGNFASSLSIDPASLTPGSSAVFSAEGTPLQSAVFTIGFAPTLVDLGQLGLGAAGCELRVLGVANVPTTFAPRPPLSAGQAGFSLQIPVDPGALNTTFYVQCIEFAFPLYTSDAKQCTIAGSLPTHPMSSVYARLDGQTVPATGTVRTGRGPVIRFSHL